MKPGDFAKLKHPSKGLPESSKLHILSEKSEDKDHAYKVRDVNTGRTTKIKSKYLKPW